MVDPRVLVFVGIWESTLLAYVCPTLVGVRFSYRQAFRVGIPHSIAIYLTRSVYQLMEVPLGTHTLVSVALMILSLRFLTRVKWRAAIAGTLIGFQMLLLGEAVILSPVLSKFQVTAEHIAEQPWLHVGLGLLLLIPLFAVALLVWRFNIRLLNLGGGRGV